MGSTDSIPLVSQIKSFVQVISGDSEGAKRTQVHFLHTFPGLSQITSAVQAIEGDKEGAKETQKEFVDSLGHFADGIPVVGHIKGAIEYAIGDKAAGDASMKAASRTVGVIAGGAAGFFAGGPAGAVLGGIAAGAAIDGIITGIDSAVHHQYTPYGEVSVVTNMVNGHYDPGEEFDFAAGIFFDGLAGLGEAGEGSLTEITSEHFTGKPIYRVVNDSSAIEAIQKQAIPPSFKGGEVWIAENTEHSRGFMKGDPVNRTKVVEVKIDKKWYTKMREENLVSQDQANVSVNIGKNVWNDEAGGAKAGSKGHWPGHGAVNIGIKHLQNDKIWNPFESEMKNLQALSEALEKPELKVTDSEIKQVNIKGPVGGEIKKVLGPIFGSTGKIPILQRANGLAKTLEERFPHLQSATDAAARIMTDITPLKEMANRFRVNQTEIMVRSEDLGHVKALLTTIRETVKDLRGSDNLSALNSHVNSMRLINPNSWKYRSTGMFKNWTAEHPRAYSTAVVSSWLAHRSTDEVKVKRSHYNESSPSDYTLANTTQKYKAPERIVVNGRTDAKGPLMEQSITVGGLAIKRIQVEGDVQLTNHTRVRRSVANAECRVYLRVWKHDSQIYEFEDIDISGPITETKKHISFDNSTVGLRYIHLRGSIELWCVVGTGRELTCTNLSCSISYGAPQFYIERSDGIVKTIFNPTRNVHLDDNSGQMVPLFWERIPLGVATIKGINVSFKAKDQGYGYRKGEIFLRIWRNETTKTEYNDYTLTDGKLEHDWKEYNWNSEEHQRIPIGAVAQLMCMVGVDGGHALYANDLKLILTLGRPQMAIVNTIDFDRQQLVEKNQVSNDFIDLYDEVVLISHDVKDVKVRFDAKDQGKGNRKGVVAMCVIKPSGEKNTILLHDGVMEHNWNSYEYNSAKVMPFKIEAADEVKFMCVVGGGGGHKLFVKNFYAVFTFHKTTRIFAPAQSVHNKNSTNSIVPLYDQKFPCGVSAVTKVTITFEAKDQGSGNLKGKIYMRVFENGCKTVIADIPIAVTNHQWTSYSYESDTIGDKIPPGSVIQYMILVGGDGGHEMHVRQFVANITYIDSPRNETVSAFNEEIRCIAKLKQIHASGATSNVVVNVVKPNGSIRTTFPLDASIHESKLISDIAIGDKLKFEPKSPGSQASFQVTASFLPLEIPNHSSIVVHFAPKLDFYGFVHGYGPENILTGDDHRLELKQKLRAVTVSCNWTDDNPEYPSTGKLLLVLKTKKGTEKGRYDVFGTVTHEWNHVMRVFASDDDIVKDANPGDHILLLHEVGENGVLRIDDLDMYMMISTP